jgi:hypothetical protein
MPLATETTHDRRRGARVSVVGKVGRFTTDVRNAVYGFDDS